MTWIDTPDTANATGRLKKLLDRVSGPDGNIDNIMLAHGLRPHTLEGHMALYKAVLHHFGNRLPKTLLETIGVHVSLTNRCAYCVEHHFAGLKRLLKDDDRAARVRDALESARLDDPVFDERTAAALGYAEKPTRHPSELAASDVTLLRDAGLDDGEILEINQVAAYFAYANRTVLGLGITTEGDALGLSPGDNNDPDNWNHG